VGLKHLTPLAISREVFPFSRTPRGFEARHASIHEPDYRPLSAEPLVGLKPGTDETDCVSVKNLSAEPLVGLKHGRSGRNAVASCAFSRTPRGFEAELTGRGSDSVKAFQPNPSWV